MRRITSALQSTKCVTSARALDSSRQACRVNKLERIRNPVPTGSSRRRRRLRDTTRKGPFFLLSAARKPSASSLSLSPQRRNKILRESNFAEKSKFSPSNSFCADSDGTPRGARTREIGRSRVLRGTVRREAHLEGRTLLGIAAKEISVLRALPMASELEVKDGSVTLIERRKEKRGGN